MSICSFPWYWFLCLVVIETISKLACIAREWRAHCASLAMHNLMLTGLTGPARPTRPTLCLRAVCNYQHRVQHISKIVKCGWEHQLRLMYSGILIDTMLALYRLEESKRVSDWWERIWLHSIWSNLSSCERPVDQSQLGQHTATTSGCLLQLLQPYC